MNSTLKRPPTLVSGFLVKGKRTTLTNVHVATRATITMKKSLLVVVITLILVGLTTNGLANSGLNTSANAESKVSKPTRKPPALPDGWEWDGG